MIIRAGTLPAKGFAMRHGRKMVSLLDSGILVEIRGRKFVCPQMLTNLNTNKNEEDFFQPADRRRERFIPPLSRVKNLTAGD